jgi:glycosyltransferase involved in cell wall biosynthesis
VILNCPPFEDLTQATTGQTIRDKLGVPDEEPILLYSGGLTPLRGIENTLLALQFLERGILVLLGGGKLRGKLEALARAYRLSGRVHFVEFIPHEEVPRFISSADVGIIPYEWVGLNHYYSSPSKLFHYIMAELPVVGSDFPFLRQVILGNDIGATFDPSRPEGITEAIRSLIGDPTRYRTVKDNLRRIKMKYCWENEEKKFLGVYQSLFLASSMSEESKPEVRLHDAV